MTRTIRIKKGADIRLKGRPSTQVEQASSAPLYAVQPPNYQGIVPKLEVKEGAAVKAGSTLFHSKEHPEVKFLSPVTGAVKQVVRGEKRRILAVVVEANGKNEQHAFASMDPAATDREALVAALAERGFFAFIEQRPFATVANPTDVPRSIHVSGFDSAPLAADMEVALAGREAAFQTGIHALRVLAGGSNVQLGTKEGQAFFNSIEGVDTFTFEGPHPTGNAGVQIHHTRPINTVSYTHLTLPTICSV